MQYEEIKHASPAGLKNKKNARRVTARAVLIFFAVLMAVFLLAGSLIQYYLGMGGIAITELMMLAMSLGFVFLTRQDIRAVFPIRKPKLTAVFACVILWIGATLLVMASSVVLMYLFPDAYSELSGESDLFHQVSPILQILIIAVLPAICEEAVHRGVLQYGISKSVKSIPALTVVMGALFAVFHIYPIKYPAMMILGGLMSYILANTGNMFYSSFVHFMNNLVSLILDIAAGGTILSIVPKLTCTAAKLQGSMPPGDLPSASLITLHFLGPAIILLTLPVPLLLHTGSWLLKRDTAPVRPSYFPEGEKHPFIMRIFLPMIGIILLGSLISLL